MFLLVLSPGYVGSGAVVQSIDRTKAQCHTVHRDKVEKRSGPLRLKSNTWPGWTLDLCLDLPFGIKHPGTPEVWFFWVRKFKSLYFITHTISREDVTRKNQSSCMADICSPFV